MAQGWSLDGGPLANGVRRSQPRPCESNNTTGELADSCGDSWLTVVHVDVNLDNSR